MTPSDAETEVVDEDVEAPTDQSTEIPVAVNETGTRADAKLDPESEYDFDDPADADPDPNEKPADDEQPADDEDAEQQTPAEETETPEPASFSPDVLNRAREMGLSDGEARQFGTEQALERAMALSDRRIATAYRKPPGDKEKAAETETKPEDEIPDLNPDSYDPELVEAWDKMKGQLKDLTEQNAQLVQVNGRRQFDEFLGWFDQRIGQLGESYEDVFGKGASGGLATDSQEYKSRDRLIEVMEGLSPVYGDKGREELFQRALKAEHGDRADENARKKIAGKLGKRQTQLTNRARNRARATRTEKPKDAAVSFAAKFMAEKGVTHEEDGI